MCVCFRIYTLRNFLLTSIRGPTIRTKENALQSYRDHRTAKIVLSNRFAGFQLVGDFQTSSLHLQVKCLH